MSHSNEHHDGSDQTGQEVELSSGVRTIPGERYEFVSVLGRGAFAETVLARDREEETHVAVKIFHPERIDAWKSYELFEREVSILKSLDHPGIPRIHDYFEASAPKRSAYLVMEYIDGETLADRIGRKGSFSSEESILLFSRLLDILEYLHTRVPPVLHRDIKPANIIIRPSGMPALIDFGSVRVVFQTPDEKGSTIIGTHGYMPYEQYLGKASPSSDLYALAATFLEVLTGRPPADFLNSRGIIAVPDGLTGGPHFVSILEKMLAHASEDRFPAVSDVRSRLYAPLVQSEPVSSVPALSSETSLSVPDGPREISAELKPYYKKFVPSFSRFMAIGTDGDIPENISPGARSLVGLGTVMSLGILPLAHWFSYRSVKRKYNRFFTQGSLVTGTIIKTSLGRSPNTGGRAYHVLYSYEINGKNYRGSNDLRPQMAQFWDHGTSVYVLYMPDNPQESVIIGEI